MDRSPITSSNRQAVEFVYMIEVETLTRGSGTHGLDDVKKLLHSKYTSLIRQISSGYFAEFGLYEKMIESTMALKQVAPWIVHKGFGCEKESAGSHSFF